MKKIVSPVDFYWLQENARCQGVKFHWCLSQEPQHISQTFTCIYFMFLLYFICFRVSQVCFYVFTLLNRISLITVFHVTQQNVVVKTRVKG